LKRLKNEQLVGCLWIVGGNKHHIPHGEFNPAFQAICHATSAEILAKFVMIPFESQCAQTWKKIS